MFLPYPSCILRLSKAGHLNHRCSASSSSSPHGSRHIGSSSISHITLHFLIAGWWLALNLARFTLFSLVNFSSSLSLSLQSPGLYQFSVSIALPYSSPDLRSSGVRVHLHSLLQHFSSFPCSPVSSLVTGKETGCTSWHGQRLCAHVAGPPNGVPGRIKTRSVNDPANLPQKYQEPQKSLEGVVFSECGEWNLLTSAA